MIFTKLSTFSFQPFMQINFLFVHFLPGNWYTWEILEFGVPMKHIYASPWDKNLVAISSNGSLFQSNGTTSVLTIMSQFNINEPVHSYTADFNVPVLVTESGKVYIGYETELGTNLIGMLSDIDTILIAQMNQGYPLEVLVNKTGGFNTSMPFYEKYVNATDVSCTNLNQSCWYLEGSNCVR